MRRTVGADGGSGLQAVEKSVLPNGLVALAAHRRGCPAAAVLVFYRAGVLEEPADKTGLAHLTEHMMFRGTRRHQRGQIDSITTGLGGFNNAVTTADYTVYYFVVPREHWRVPLVLEADRMTNLALTPGDFETEKRVAIEERLMLDDDPDTLLEEAVDSLAFSRHPYRRPVVGLLDDLVGVTLDDLRAFYEKYYGPENAVVVVAGDVHGPEVLASVGELFGPVPSRGRPSTRTEEDPPPTSPRWRTVSGDVASARIVIAFRCPEATHPDAPAVDVAAAVLGTGRSSRLHRRLVVLDRTASEVSVEWLLQREPGLLTLSANLHPESDPKRCEEALLDVVRPLSSGELADAELRKAGALSRVDLVLSRETSLGLGGTLGFWELLGGWETGVEFERRVLGVTAADVRRVAATWLDPDARTSVWLLPEGA